MNNQKWLLAHYQVISRYDKTHTGAICLILTHTKQNKNEKHACSWRKASRITWFRYSCMSPGLSKRCLGAFLLSFFVGENAT